MGRDINEIFDKARAADKLNKPVFEVTSDAELSTHTVEVNAYGSEGVYIEAEKVTVKYEIQVQWASYGIAGIEVWPRGKVEVYMSIDAGKEFSVIIDFGELEVPVEYMSGQAYVAESLDVYVNKDLKLEKVIFNCFAIGK